MCVCILFVCVCVYACKYKYYTVFPDILTLKFIHYAVDLRMTSKQMLISGVVICMHIFTDDTNCS